MSNKLSFDYKFGFAKPDVATKKTSAGLNRSVVAQISEFKQEPKWMLDFRLKAYSIFKSQKMPSWGANLKNLNLDKMIFYSRSVEEKMKSWRDLPEQIKDTYDRIGVPEAERDFLAGVSAQYDSEVVYKSVKKELAKRGVLFSDMDTALREHPDIVKQYFSKLISPDDNKFAALNSALWSGGSFVYIPKGVEVTLPLQAYFRINAERFGQFERTLIIAEEGSYVHYVEGCTAPIYTTDSLHAAVVEIFVKKGARVRYTTVQNWSNNVYNLVTKRAIVEQMGKMEWIDCNLGSKVTMKYPSVILSGENSVGETLSIAYASDNQHQDAGAKMIHLAPNTSSRIVSKSISKNGGRTSYRGLVKVNRSAHDCKVSVSCDALILDPDSRSDTYPCMDISQKKVQIEHEATVEKLGEEKLFYLASRGIENEAAQAMLVNGFIEPITREIPLEYSIELNRLIQLQMEGSVG